MESKAVDGCKSEADSYHWAFMAYLGGSDLWGAVVLVRVIPPPSLSADHILSQEIVGFTSVAFASDPSILLINGWITCWQTHQTWITVGKEEIGKDFKSLIVVVKTDPVCAWRTSANFD